MCNIISRKISDQHKKSPKNYKWNEKPVNPVFNKRYFAFFPDTFDNEKTADQEHQRHQEHIIKVNENIKSNLSFDVHNCMC